MRCRAKKNMGSEAPGHPWRTSVSECRGFKLFATPGGPWGCQPWMNVIPVYSCWKKGGTMKNEVSDEMTIGGEAPIS